MMKNLCSKSEFNKFHHSMNKNRYQIEILSVNMLMALLYSFSAVFKLNVSVTKGLYSMNKVLTYEQIHYCMMDEQLQWQTGSCNLLRSDIIVYLTIGLFMSNKALNCRIYSLSPLYPITVTDQPKFNLCSKCGTLKSRLFVLSKMVCLLLNINISNVCVIQVTLYKNNGLFKVRQNKKPLNIWIQQNCLDSKGEFLYHPTCLMRMGAGLFSLFHHTKDTHLYKNKSIIIYPTQATDVLFIRYKKILKARITVF